MLKQKNKKELFLWMPSDLLKVVLPFKKHCNVIFSIPLIKEHHDSYLYSIQNKTYESRFDDEPFTTVLNPV